MRAMQAVGQAHMEHKCTVMRSYTYTGVRQWDCWGIYVNPIYGVNVNFLASRPFTCKHPLRKTLYTGGKGLKSHLIFHMENP